ncbi:MAG: IS110 family transposase [Rhodospirillaceae bacterium]|jgi:transposase|nr:IS110 family transposase [Alphaproteobacteria bacterium]MBT5562250.1 IS110 family transposase [Rhodospirillaceae bacterium]
MSEVITIGVDLAKNIFQVHGIDAEGAVIFCRQLRRTQMLPFFKKQPPCLVGMEACATSHHWARQLIELGHEVKLMPPHYVKPYVKRNKNDMADAEAICEAVTRPTMRFVSVKSMEQQSVLMLHRTRNLLVRQRTMLINAIRAHMAEFGIVAPGGVPQVKKLLSIIADTDDARLPPIARTCLESLARHFLSLHQEIHVAEKHIHAWHRSNDASRRLETIPGIGPIIASALTASITDPEVFKNGRELAAWIGLVPRQNSTGGKQRLGKISKQGDQYLRWLLVAGAMSVILHAKRRGTTNLPWLANIIARKPAKVAAVALANKNARIVWALLRQGGTYEKPATTPAI